VASRSQRGPLTLRGGSGSRNYEIGVLFLCGKLSKRVIYQILGSSLYSVTVTTGPLRLMWPRVKMSLTPLS